MTGLVVCAAVLGAATVFGAVWRRRNGVLRVVRAGPHKQRPRHPAAGGQNVGGASGGGASGGGASDGGASGGGAPGGGAPGTGAPGTGAPGAGCGAYSDGDGEQTTAGGRGRGAGVLTAAQLGRPLGSRATLVQFSTAFCAPCRGTRRILADAARMVDGVVHVEVDAEANLGLVRSLGIHTTPAVFVLGADGTILRRGTGQPRKADVIAAIGAIAPGPQTTQDGPDTPHDVGRGTITGPGLS